MDTSYDFNCAAAHATAAAIEAAEQRIVASAYAETLAANGLNIISTVVAAAVNNTHYTTCNTAITAHDVILKKARTEAHQAAQITYVSTQSVARRKLDF